tara:strand:+ start:4510 stop:6045 length:1536 start_codon:yes stop_codon:yes gene_type:complete
MKYDLAIIGFGVIGVESLHAIATKINKNKKINIAIIEKDIKNIPGGVAYSKLKSKFGFFNNPLRLSHPSFKSWIQNKKNIHKIINFIKKNPTYNLEKWLLTNIKNLLKKNIPGETYFPRLVYSFYLEDKIFDFFKIKSKKKIKISFFRGNAEKLVFNKKYLIIRSKNNFTFFKINTNKNLIDVKNLDQKIKFIECKKIILGNGLLPPKKIKVSNKHLAKNYIWDFYSEGGTSNLLKKIEKFKNFEKKIIITFIGNKAGLLETMLQLKDLIFKKNYNIFINIISKKIATLNKAKFSNKIKKYKFIFFVDRYIDEIKKAVQILDLLKKEFKNARISNYNKYDVWTEILSKKILNRSIQKLNKDEKKIYNLFIFPKIRNITRFTYPEPISAKEYLDNYKKITMVKGKAVSITSLKNILFVKMDNKKIIKSHIVVNVSGPVNLDQLNSESNLINSIKSNINKFDKRGFITDKNFMLTDQIYAPGIISYNFNPSRQTIIKAITNNSQKIVKAILKK